MSGAGAIEVEDPLRLRRMLEAKLLSSEELRPIFLVSLMHWLRSEDVLRRAMLPVRIVGQVRTSAWHYSADCFMLSSL